MFNKNLWLRVVSLLVILSAIAAVPAFASAPSGKITGNYAVNGTGNTGEIAMPSAGMGSIVLINYNGAGGAPLLVDFNGVDYVIPPSTEGGSGVWNHVEINLAPGTYTYTASVANKGFNTSAVQIAAGKVTSLGFLTNPDQHHTSINLALLAFPGDMTAQAK